MHKFTLNILIYINVLIIKIIYKQLKLVKLFEFFFLVKLEILIHKI